MQRRLVHRDSYLAGLWRRDFLFELLWDFMEPRLLQQQCPSKEYSAPAWSWASRTGEIIWETETWLATAQRLVEIADASVTRIGLNDMGQDFSGYVKLYRVLAREVLQRQHQTGALEPRASLRVGSSILYGTTNRADDGFNFKDPTRWKSSYAD